MIGTDTDFSFVRTLFINVFKKKKKKSQETYTNEDEVDAMDFYCLWRQRDYACRFGNEEEIGNGIFQCTENVSHGEGLCTPFSGYKRINLNWNLPWNAPILLALQHLFV